MAFQYLKNNSNSNGLRQRLSNRLTILFLSAIVLFSLIGEFAKIMFSLNHNENMYITASILVVQNKIPYKDFAYVQMPYLPLLYGNLYRLMKISSYYLLIGKIISFLSLCISAAAIFFVAHRVIKDVSLSLSVGILFLLNTSILGSAMEVSNYIIPIALSLVSFALFEVSINSNRVRPFGFAIAGFFLAVAIGVKLTYATVAIPFIVVCILHQVISRFSTDNTNNKTSFVYILLPFITGLLVGLLPIFFYLSDIGTFIFNNYGYHIVNAQWRQDTGYTSGMSLFSKIIFARDIFFQTDNLILILGVLLGIVLFAKRNSRTIRQTIKEELTKGTLLAFLLFLIAIPTAFAPTPSFPQYFVMPVSFLFLLLVYSQAPKPSQEPSKLLIRILHKKLILILVLVSLMYNGPSLGKSIYHLMNRNSWSGLYVHDISINIRNTLLINGVDINSKIATLSPLYVIEANLPIYSELSTGPFTYRIGDLLTSEDRKHFVVTSPNSIWNLLSKDRPSAILVGFEEDLDIPFIVYAVAHHYKKVDGFFGGGDLYILKTDKP